MTMLMRSTIRCCRTLYSPVISQSVRGMSASVQSHDQSQDKFETVFTLPVVKYMALLNRLKVYHGFGMIVAMPTAALLELFSAVPEKTFLIVSYIGISSMAVLALASIPFKNVIGHLYISQDNKLIKISSVDFWGRRQDRIVNTEDWIPLLDMKLKPLDAVYLSPQLTDGTKYKLLLKFGKVLNSSKMGQVLE